MEKNSVRERLARLHAELNDAHRGDPEAHRPLGEILPEIKRLTLEPETLGTSGADGTLPQRLEQIAVQFEADHPALAGSVRRIIDLLGEVGI
jgi:hypothetical protein